MGVGKRGVGQTLKWGGKNFWEFLKGWENSLFLPLPRPLCMYVFIPSLNHQVGAIIPSTNFISGIVCFWQCKN